MVYKIFNRTTAQAEADSLAKQIKARDPSYTAPPLPLRVGQFNNHLREMREKLAAANGAPIKPSAPATSPWSHIHDDGTRALLERSHPAGPVSLRAAMGTATAAPAAPSHDMEAIAKATLGRQFTEGRDPVLQLWQHHVDLSAVGIADNDARFARAFRQPLKGVARVTHATHQENFNRITKNK